jgi:hypothetical protein
VQAEYWTCNWITFMTGARITCGVLRDGGIPGMNRYPGYWKEGAPDAVITGRDQELEKAYRKRASARPELIKGFVVFWNPPPALPSPPPAPKQ